MSRAVAVVLTAAPAVAPYPAMARVSGRPSAREALHTVAEPDRESQHTSKLSATGAAVVGAGRGLPASGTTSGPTSRASAPPLLAFGDVALPPPVPVQ